MSEAAPRPPTGSPAPFLVTGASGFLARHLFAVRDDRPLLALVRDPATFSDYDWTGDLDDVPRVTGSVTRPDEWTGALPPLGGIFHLAAEVRHSRHRPDGLFETNVEGTLAMVRLAARHRCRIVVVSTTGTVACFDDPNAVGDETSPYRDEITRRWPYYRGKIEMERRARALAEAEGVELVIVRPPILLGPGDHRFRSTSNVLRALRGRLPFLIRGGMIFSDVRDAAQAIWRAGVLPKVRPVYHLDATVCSVEEFFGMLEEVSGVPAPRFVLAFAPAWLLATAVQRLSLLFGDEPSHLLPDPVVIEMASRYWGARSLYAADDLGDKCRDPRETLRDTADWLRAHHESLRPQAGCAGR